MAIRVKLVRSMSGHTEKHRETLRGLGLTRVGKSRVVQDTPETKGHDREDRLSAARSSRPTRSSSRSAGATSARRSWQPTAAKK